MTPVELVVFDIGNVLIEWQPEAYYDRVFGQDFRRSLFEAVDLHAMNDRIDRGADFAAVVAETAAAHPKFSQAISHWHDQWHLIAAPVIKDSAQSLSALKARKVRTAILSNIGEVPFEIAQAAYPFLSDVDFPFLSGPLKMAKPDPSIYAYVERATGVAPEAMLFVDDRGENIAAARERGWQVHHFQGAAGWLETLATHGLR